VQNIGAYGVEIANFVANVEAINLETGAHEFFSDSACKYGYRESVFKNEGKGAYAITRVHLRLNRTFTPKCAYGTIEQELTKRGITTPTASQLRQVIIDIRNAKLPDPKEVGSAGSFFMNPVVSQEVFESLKASYPDMPNYPQAEGVKIPAGWLIEQCGWKGKSLGRAGVYEKQALVLVNRGGATGVEVATLANTIVTDVRQKFGITITPEANLI
jgi:UDP-N-acetylmuramate dehydrogenase